MKGNVILPYELNVVDILGIPPPVTPIALRCLVGPFLGRCDIRDRRVEPDIEDFVLKTRAWHRDAPGEVTGNAAISQFGGKPALRQRTDESRPALAAVDPIVQGTDEL